MTIRDDVHRVLDECEKNIGDAADIIYNSERMICIYVIKIGLESIQSKRRRENRRAIKQELRPTYVKGRTTGSFQFSKKTKMRLAAIQDRVFGPDGWMIGNMNVGDLSKASLLAVADREELQAKGSVQNVRIYRALAEPMTDKQTVREAWSKKEFHRLAQEIRKSTDEMQVDLR
jgi:hypothetical protein